MKTIFSLVLLLYFSQFLPAQLQDDFSDGDFQSDPEWMGNTELFTVSNETLQLFDQDPASSNTAYLYLAAATSTDTMTTWAFRVRLEFAPSPGNFARVYLSASAPELSGDQEGYFVRIGGITGDGDALELYRQDGEETVLLISGTAGSLGADPAVAAVRVVRSEDGEWELLADYSGGDDYQSEGGALDHTYPAGAFFGFYCRYSSTRSESFFFDDVLIDPLYVDESPPVLLEAEAISAGELFVRFDEPLGDGADEPANYFINNGIGQPVTAVPEPGQPAQLRLSLSENLQNLNSYELTATGIADLNGNISGSQAVSFTYIEIEPAAPGDILISEIMADPNPVVALPDEEYVELFNRSNKVIELENFRFSSGGNPQALPPFLLLPGAHLILCDDSAEAAFAPFGEAAGLASFPALTNDGDELSLLDPQGNLIHQVAYDDSWYRDELKENGGWSLELIDPEAPSDCAANWLASESPLGGTPGITNSRFGDPVDTVGPRLIGAIALSEVEVLLAFDEPPEVSLAEFPDLYIIDHDITVGEAMLQGPLLDTVRLLLSTPLQAGQIYTVRVSGDLIDCLGNPAPSSIELAFLLTRIDPLDLVINELLFNPETGGSEFLELYNRSDKAINLSGMVVENTQRQSGNNRLTFGEDFLFLPGSYAVLTEKPEDILDRFAVQDPEALIAVGDLPTLEDRSGNVTIRYQGITIDSFDYSESLHSELLRDRNGVSLERTDPEAPTQSAGSWHSAATTQGGGTPTYRNSQFFQASSMIEKMIELPRRTFSPDGDGFEDFLPIDYQVDQAGFLLNIHIFDARGRPVKRLVDNELLASQGRFIWDGSTNDGLKARIGIYILWIELFTPDGRVEQRKESCVLAGKLD